MVVCLENRGAVGEFGVSGSFFLGGGTFAVKGREKETHAVLGLVVPVPGTWWGHHAHWNSP